MDSHYDQVMRARAEAATSPPRLYFAYSTVLDRSAFEQWRAEHGYEFFQLPEGRIAEALGVDLVYDFPSRWWGGRVAGLVDRSGASVYGRLFEIVGADWPIVQHKEGAVTGMSVERPVRVRVDGQELDGIAFTTRPERSSPEGPISTRFVEALVRGARSAGLPADYIERIRTSAR
jgi:gamma-glutamylcyclotransferase